MRMQRSGSFVDKDDMILDKDRENYENYMSNIIEQHGPEKRGKHSMKVKIVKWQ
jgi:hypothetical protein